MLVCLNAIVMIFRRKIRTSLRLRTNKQTNRNEQKKIPTHYPSNVANINAGQWYSMPILLFIEPKWNVILPGPAKSLLILLLLLHCKYFSLFAKWSQYTPRVVLIRSLWICVCFHHSETNSPTFWYASSGWQMREKKKYVINVSLN